MRRVLELSVLCAIASIASGGEVRLNQIQVIGTHNSYHIALGPAA